jgi:hypothetical protein
MSTVIYGDQLWTATWSAADAATLEAIIATAPPGFQFGLGVQPRTVRGVTSYFLSIHSTVGDVGPPPEDVMLEEFPMLAQASPGPQRPEPGDWLKTAGITGARLLEVIAGMRRDPRTSAIWDAMMLMRRIDVTADDVRGSVAEVLAAGAITEAEAAKLLA